MKKAEMSVTDKDVTDALHDFEAEAIHLTRETGRGGFVISMPFIHGDGDSWTVVMEMHEGVWWLTDRGDTVGHLWVDNIEVTIQAERHMRQHVARHGGEVSDHWEIRYGTGSAKLPDGYHLADFLILLAGVDALAHALGEVEQRADLA